MLIGAIVLGVLLVLIGLWLGWEEQGYFAALKQEYAEAAELEALGPEVEVDITVDTFLHILHMTKAIVVVGGGILLIGLGA